jgi:hypothetical protein
MNWVPLTSLKMQGMSFYLLVLHPVGHLSNWFFMMPSITTKFQYVNSPFIFTHYMFRPLRAIFRSDIQLDIFKDYFWLYLTYWNFVAIDGIIRNQLAKYVCCCKNMIETRVLETCSSFNVVPSFYTNIFFICKHKFGNIVATLSCRVLPSVVNCSKVPWCECFIFGNNQTSQWAKSG